ncbi:MAG: AAA family ATPase [Paludibacter sp.]|nr:AAA family ATPase [Paludibacter sp.]
MKSFYNTHLDLVANVHAPVRRLLMDEIDWSHRLIGIKGSRGVGKTTFLLQYAKERFGNDKKCLYINFNNLYFTEHSLVEFAGKFYEQGGRTLLIDQTFKYENWSQELRICYDSYPELQIIFSGSSVMRLIEDNKDIQNIVALYNLRGFSFREFINLKTGLNLPPHSLDDMLDDQVSISKSIRGKVNPMSFFQDYLVYGYYPFFLEDRNYSENLLKTMNMMMEVDILLIKQIDLKYLSKIRRLLYLIMNNAPGPANISQLAVEINTSRATIMNYIKYLKDARLLNTLYVDGEDYPKKPKQLYVHNTNLMHAVFPDNTNQEAEKKTFLYNALHAKHKVNTGRYHSDFCVDKKINFKYDTKTTNRHGSKIHFAVDAMETTNKNEIPLWLFGFLY